MMSLRAASSPRKASAGGQEEQPCEVKSSTTTASSARAAPASSRAAAMSHAARQCSLFPFINRETYPQRGQEELNARTSQGPVTPGQLLVMAERRAGECVAKLRHLA